MVDNNKGDNFECAVEGGKPAETEISTKDKVDTGKVKKVKKAVTPHTKWLMIQITSWIWLLAIITLVPVMMKMAYYSSETETYLAEKYVPPTVLTLHFGSSILIGLVMSYCLYGMKGVKDCFERRGITMQALLSLGYTVSEILALTAMKTADPIMYAIIHKMRILMTAIMTQFILRRSVSKRSWIICFMVTFMVLAFVLYSINQTNARSETDLAGALFLVVNITASVICSIYADWVYKKLNHPLPVQMVQGRITATLGALVLSLSFITIKGWWQYGFFGGPDGGWDRRVVFLYLFMIVRDWSNCFVLLHLDALWKAKAGACAVASTYVVDILIYKKKVVPTLCCLVIAIVMGILLYALVRKLEREYKAATDSNRELMAKIKQCDPAFAEQYEQDNKIARKEKKPDTVISHKDHKG